MCVYAYDAVGYKFTGKERDAETGLDYLGARYYSSAMGRFATPDWSSSPSGVPYADLHNPQSLNLYLYVENNPESLVDPTGHFVMSVDAEADYANGGPPASAQQTPPPPQQQQPDQEEQAQEQVDVGFVKGIVNFFTSAENEFLSMGESTSGPIPQMQASNDAQALGMAGANVMGALVGLASFADAPAATSGVQANRAAGLAFQDAKAAETATTDTNVVQNLRVTTTTGTRTEIDIASRNSGGGVRLQETKGSQTARLTPNQTRAHPEIGRSGATVVSRNKPGYPAGTRIPPTKVEVVRPPAD